MNYTKIIWDFNGTILDDVDAGIKSENTLLKRRGMPLIESVDYYRNIFCFPIEEYYKKLGHDFTKEPYSELAVEWVKEYEINSKASGLVPGVEELLEYFSVTGARQIILSASEKKLLRQQVRELGIYGYFSEILGLDNIYARSKVKLATEWLKTSCPGKALFIGDTLHDLEVARTIGIDCILVASGHQSYEILKNRGCPVYKTMHEAFIGLSAE